MESFFEFCAKYKVVDLVQIYKEYDYNLLRRVPVRKLATMTERIRAEQKEMILFKVYSQLLGRMSKETYISFSDFVAMTEMDNRPEKEILAELANMEKEMEGTNGAVQTVRQHSDQE